MTALLFQLQLLPVTQHVILILDLHLPVNMRVTIAQLGTDLVQYICHIKLFLFLSDQCIKHDMHDQISQLLFHLLHIIFQNCISQFIDFFHGQRPQRLHRLFMIPRTLFPQGFHYIQELGKSFFLFCKIFLHNKLYSREKFSIPNFQFSIVFPTLHLQK